MFSKPHIDHLPLPCPRLPKAFEGLKVLHLSDLHITRWSRELDRWRETLSALAPDVLVITGDLGHRSWLWKISFESLQRFLEPLAPPLGTYFILGNHDSIKLGPALAQTKDSAGRPRMLLQNETVFITPNGKGWVSHAPTADASSVASGESSPRLALIGVHQHRRIDTDIPLALRPVRPSDFKLMLLHYPDLVHQGAAAGADICLAGHTHGGQICWPDGSPLFGQDSLAPAMCTGVHRIGETWMVVNRGIGKAGLRIRAFCPPHAVFITLQAGQPRG